MMTAQCNKIYHISLLPGLFQKAASHELQIEPFSNKNGVLIKHMLTYHVHDAVENSCPVQNGSSQPPTHMYILVYVH